MQAQWDLIFTSKWTVRPFLILCQGRLFNFQGLRQLEQVSLLRKTLSCLAHYKGSFGVSDFRFVNCV